VKNVIIILGSFVLSAIIMSVPVLATCSFTLNWNLVFKFILAMCTIAEYAALTIIIGTQE
jgi:hypothetical protein